jgi:hypothetical protein
MFQFYTLLQHNFLSSTIPVLHVFSSPAFEQGDKLHGTWHERYEIGSHSDQALPT